MTGFYGDKRWVWLMIRIRNKFLSLSMIIVGTIHSAHVLAQPKVTIAFQSPLEHYLAQNVLFFKQELETISRNSITVDINDYGSYLKSRNDSKDIEAEPEYFRAKDMLEAVQNRKIDVGMVSLSRLSKSIPLADVFNQPFFHH